MRQLQPVKVTVSAQTTVLTRHKATVGPCVITVYSTSAVCLQSAAGEGCKYDE
jgi:hypothetical protein